MVFITVGTTDFPFERMDRVVSEVASEFPNEEIVYQSKSTKLRSKNNLQTYKELKYPKFIKYIKGTKAIITHGGPATIFLALKNCKYKPYVLPRKKKLNEHVSDHQVYYARFLAKKKLVKLTSGRENVIKQIIKYCQNPEPNTYSSGPDQLSDLVNKLEKKIDNF